MDLPVLLNALGALGTLAFLTEMIRLFVNRKRDRLEIQSLENTTKFSHTEQALTVFTTLQAALESQVKSQQERITYLEAQLEARDAKIEALSTRLTGLMEELSTMQIELRDLRNQ